MDSEPIVIDMDNHPLYPEIFRDEPVVVNVTWTHNGEMRTYVAVPLDRHSYEQKDLT